jgi:hypothetical protein
LITGGDKRRRGGFKRRRGQEEEMAVRKQKKSCERRTAGSKEIIPENQGDHHEFSTPAVSNISF